MTTRCSRCSGASSCSRCSFLWIFIVIWAFVDNFRRTDHHGVAKALWFLFIVFVPVIGVFSYILTRPVDPYVVVTDV